MFLPLLLSWQFTIPPDFMLLLFLNKVYYFNLIGGVFFPPRWSVNFMHTQLPAGRRVMESEFWIDIKFPGKHREQNLETFQSQMWNSFSCLMHLSPHLLNINLHFSFTRNIMKWQMLMYDIWQSRTCDSSYVSSTHHSWLIFCDSFWNQSSVWNLHVTHHLERQPWTALKTSIE